MYVYVCMYCNSKFIHMLIHILCIIVYLVLRGTHWFLHCDTQGNPVVSEYVMHADLWDKSCTVLWLMWSNQVYWTWDLCIYQSFALARLHISICYYLATLFRLFASLGNLSVADFIWYLVDGWQSQSREELQHCRWHANWYYAFEEILGWGWVFLERTRFLSGIQFITHFIEYVVVETKTIRR